MAKDLALSGERDGMSEAVRIVAGAAQRKAASPPSSPSRRQRVQQGAQQQRQQQGPVSPGGAWADVRQKKERQRGQGPGRGATATSDPSLAKVIAMTFKVPVGEGGEGGEGGEEGEGGEGACSNRGRGLDRRGDEGGDGGGYAVDDGDAWGAYDAHKGARGKGVRFGY